MFWRCQSRKLEFINQIEMSIFPIFVGFPASTWHKPSNVPFGTADVMNIQSFIGVSSAILLAWLGATYLHKVPTESYPKQGRSSSPITGQSEDTSGKMIADNVSGIPVKP